MSRRSPFYSTELCQYNFTVACFFVLMRALETKLESSTSKKNMDRQSDSGLYCQTR